MQAFANVIRKIQAYGDKLVSSNPRLKYVDWNRDVSGKVVQNPRSESFAIDPGSSLQVFSGVRSTTIGSNTAFAVAGSTLDPSRYRFTWTGGTNPTLRTDRSLTLNGIAVTLAVNLNATVNISVPSLASFDFTGVLAGDTIFLPGPATGDAATPFSTMNQGAWIVLAVTDSKHLIISRPIGSLFTGTSETQTLTSNAQLLAFSATGVQVGDVVDISNGFPTTLEQAFEIVAVTSQWFEVVSVTPLPAVTGALPTASGMIFYNMAKSYVYVEVDQEAAVQVNGDTGQSNRLSPDEPGNPDKPGSYEKKGVTWSLSIVNRSQVSLNAVVLHWE